MLPRRRMRCPFRALSAPRPLVLRSPAKRTRRPLAARAGGGGDWGSAPGEAPPIDGPPPPPPPPPPGGPQFSRRAVFGSCFVGSGLWFSTNGSSTPDAKFFRPKDPVKGLTMMRAESGAVYGMASVRSKEAGRNYLIMVDSRGNVFYDPSDREQGLYVVTPDEVMYNIHEAEDAEDDDAGGLVFTRLGKLGDLNMVDIEGIADLKLGKGGTQLWLFDSMDDPLVLDPGAVINKGKDGTRLAMPAEVNDGWIENIKENKGLFGLGKGNSNKLAFEP